MQKFRKDITSQGFYDKYQIWRNFKPGEVATEEEIKRFGISEHLLEPLTENEKKTLEKIEEKDENQKVLEELNAQPFLGKIEFSEEKKEPVKKKRGRPKKKKQIKVEKRSDLDWLNKKNGRKTKNKG